MIFCRWQAPCLFHAPSLRNTAILGQIARFWPVLLLDPALWYTKEFFLSLLACPELHFNHTAYR
jgi:hypothetical protein